MKRLVITGLLALTMLGPVAHAVDTETMPVANAGNRDYAAGKKAVERRDWASAAASFRKVVDAEPENADGYNMLGFSLRWMGKMDDAFAAYDRALQLNPKHKGALEYSGVAYLKADQPAKANEQLVRLEKVGGKYSDEYRDLAKAISDYNAGRR